MRVLICGSRHWTDEETIANYIKTLLPGSVVIHGAALGADRMAAQIAKEHGHTPLPFEANWDLYGDPAGPIRNREMLDVGKPDMVVAFHDNIEESKGTKDMIEETRRRGIPNILIHSKMKNVEFSECLTSDCVDNNRAEGFCRLKAQKHGDKRECLSYVKDMKWLQEDWWG